MKDRNDKVIWFYLKVRHRLRNSGYSIPLWDELPHAVRCAYRAVYDLTQEEIERVRRESGLTVTGDYGII